MLPSGEIASIKDIDDYVARVLLSRRDELVHRLGVVEGTIRRGEQLLLQHRALKVQLVKQMSELDEALGGRIGVDPGPAGDRGEQQPLGRVDPEPEPAPKSRNGVPSDGWD